MNLLFFNTRKNACAEDRVCKQIAHTLPEIRIKMFSDVPLLIEWLQLPPRNFFAAVMIPDNCEILADLIKAMPYFADRKTIIIVPQGDPEMLGLAHKFGFSYIQGHHNDFTAVISLLENWLENERNARRWIE